MKIVSMMDHWEVDFDALFEQGQSPEQCLATLKDLAEKHAIPESGMQVIREFSKDVMSSYTFWGLINKMNARMEGQGIRLIT